MDEYFEHIIARGETLSGIARRYNTTVAELAQLNDISDPDLIYAGATIRVPVTEAGFGTYTIRRGDTLSGLAQRYNTTTQNLAQLNGIENPDLIYAGDTLRVPAGGTSYTVQRGDTLWAIARRFGTTVNALARYNGIATPSRIYPGQVIRIP